MAFLLSAPAFAASNPTARLPEAVYPELEKILEASVGDSWRMIEETLRVEEARAEAEVYGSGRYPSLRGTFRYTGRLEDRSDFESVRSFYQPQAALTARQPLYHWGALEANDRIGRIRLAMVEENRAEAYRMLVLQVRSAFLALTVQREAIALATREVELARLEHALAAEQFARGEIAVEEEADKELAAAEGALRLERLHRDHARAVEELSRLAGIDLTDGLEGLFSAVAPESEPVEAIDWIGGGGYKPWLEVSRGRLLLAREELQAERVRDYPKFDLIAGVAQDQVAVFDRDDINRTVIFGGVELSWNLFDGFESRGRESAALARRRREARRHERELREWRADMVELTEAMNLADRAWALARERSELGRRLLLQQEEDHAEGLLSEIELAAARVVAGEKELAAARARADALMAVAEWLSEAGMDPVMETYRSYYGETSGVADGFDER